MSSHSTTTTNGSSLSIVELANQVQLSTQVIDDYFRSTNLPTLKSTHDASPFFPQSPQNIIAARRTLLDACNTLTQLIETSSEYVIKSAQGHHCTAVLQYLVHYRIADHVPSDGSMISYSDLTRNAHVNEGICKRIVRLAMTMGYFIEPQPGMLAHTANSKFLTAPHTNETLSYLLEETYPAAAFLCQGLERYPNSEERHETSWNAAHGIDKPIFEFFETSPVRMKRFMGAMSHLGSVPGFQSDWTIHGYDWKSLGNGTMVDVAGSNGHVSFALSKVFPNIKFIVQDLEKVVGASGQQTADKKDDRVTFQIHDMFTTNPVKNADVYFLRFILHDYSDKYSAKILQNLVPAMGPKSRLLIAEILMPPAGSISPLLEKHLRYVIFLINPIFD